MSSAPASATATSTDTSQTFPSSARPGKPIVPPGPDVKNAVTAVLVSGVPSLACDRYVTRNFVRTIFGSRQGCVDSTIPSSAANSVKVTEIRIEDGTATARAFPSGGPSGGERVTVHLVRYRSYWKVDSLRSNAPVGP